MYRRPAGARGRHSQHTTTTRHAMTDYDITALGLMPEQYDQRLTAALQCLRNARALLDECSG